LYENYGVCFFDEREDDL
jgi:hypothetical protein